MYIGVHVDDIVLAGKDERQFPKIKDDFSKRFDIKDLGEIKESKWYKIKNMDRTTCLTL